MPALGVVLWLAGGGLAHPPRRPANPANVTFYNLRPHNLSTDIIEKDSADAMGDIFFYITDRLLVPYACRNAKGSTPFMCRDFQKRLQTTDQVYAKLVVEVDANYGGCESGNESCTAYADCNPRSCPKSDPDCPVEWQCDCGENGASTRQAFSRAAPGWAGDEVAPYWQCSDALSRYCPIYGDVTSCEKCASENAAILDQNGCTAALVARSCASDFHECAGAVATLGCPHPPAATSAECFECLQTPSTERSNCSAYVLGYMCEPVKPCNATGMLEVTTRYCGLQDPDTGLCARCADSCDGIWDHWKSEIAALGGIWYSTTREGNCADPSADCAWRVVENVKTINASCANEKVHTLVQGRGQQCFDQCNQPRNTTSDCWILCFFETVLGRDPLHLAKLTGAVPMTRAEIEGAWSAAFESDNPTKGGCPPVGVAQSPLIGSGIASSLDES